MSTSLPRHDPYAAHRCASCQYMCTHHQAGRCHAGDHTVPCGCASWDGTCGCITAREAS